MFFYELGLVKLSSKRLEDTFKLLDEFVYNNIKLDYDEFHKILINDYLNVFNIKPSCWWKESLLPKEKNEILRENHENGTLPYDLNILYKYSLVIPLKKNIIVAIYKDNTRKIYVINK